MKRIHIHVGVEDLATGVAFYSALFGAGPVKTKPDYAKWMLDDPCVNFAVSTRTGTKGVDHLGIQVEGEEELAEIRDRLHTADLAVFDQGETVCCYARSEKTWVEDPAGIAWETYQTMEDAQVFSTTELSGESACCAPEAKGRPDCCVPSEETAGCCE